MKLMHIDIRYYLNKKKLFAEAEKQTDINTECVHRQLIFDELLWICQERSGESAGVGSRMIWIVAQPEMYIFGYKIINFSCGVP